MLPTAGLLVCQGVPGRVGMRDVYWRHIQEAQKRLQESNPGVGKKEILNMAREECRPKLSYYGLTREEVVIQVQHIHIPIDLMQELSHKILDRNQNPNVALGGKRTLSV